MQNKKILKYVYFLESNRLNAIIFMLLISATIFWGEIFNIAHAGSAGVRIISPEPGAVWEIGKVYTIKWKASGVDDVGIYIFNYNENVGGSGMTNYVTPGSFKKIAASKGSYNWTIQQNQLLSYSTDDMRSFKIKIYGYDKNGKEVAFSESKKFTIMPSKTTEKYSDKKCLTVQQKSNEKLAQFIDKKEKHMAVYVDLIDRINKLIARTNEVKLDTSTAESHLAELQTKIDKFKQSADACYLSVIEAIEEISVGCQNLKGFKGKLAESRTLLQQVNMDSADIRAYVREIILTDLQGLKIK